MKCYPVIIILLLFAACHTKKNVADNIPRVTVPVQDAADTAGNFFPVTEYLKGQIAEIKTNGITPVDRVTIKGHTDSSWLNSDAKMQQAFADFLSPVIDTANLKKIFIEKKFKDETLNAFTFTYDPANGAADSFPFRHWDVYVSPDNNKVKRIYLVKQAPGGRMLQMTWQSGKWCKIVTLKNTGDHTEIEKEEKISLTYDKE